MIIDDYSGINMSYYPYRNAVKLDNVQGGQSRDQNRFLCTSIQTEPFSKLAIFFLKLNDISWGKVHMIHSKLLYNSQYNVRFCLLDNPEQPRC